MFGYCRTKGVFITFLTVQNNGRTLSTLNGFFGEYKWNEDLHPRIVAEKANAAHLGIVSVNYGSSTEMVRFIARQANPQTSDLLRGPYEPRSKYCVRLR